MIVVAVAFASAAFLALAVEPSTSDPVIGLAQSIAALGATGILALIFVLWLSGRIHADAETKQSNANAAEALAYREALRKEAVDDRRAADARVDALTKALAESNELTRRALDLAERRAEDRPAARDSRAH